MKTAIEKIKAIADKRDLRGMDRVFFIREKTSAYNSAKAADSLPYKPPTIAWKTADELLDAELACYN